MNFIHARIPEILIIEPRVYSDARGYFMETYHAEKYAQAGIPDQFVQDNHSGSRQGVLRGLHYQIQHAQGKLVRVVAGEIFDVAVDIRRSSPTFGQWVGMVLSSENKRQVWVPAGFAHGFYVTSDWAEVVYKTTDFYSPENERTLLWNDPEVGVEWPIPKNTSPELSAKDAQGKLIRQAETFE